MQLPETACTCRLPCNLPAPCPHLHCCQLCCKLSCQFLRTLPRRPLLLVQLGGRCRARRLLCAAAHQPLEERLHLCHLGRQS